MLNPSEDDVQSDLISSSSSGLGVVDQCSFHAPDDRCSASGSANNNSDGEDECSSSGTAENRSFVAPESGSDVAESSFLTVSGRKHKVYTEEFKQRAVNSSVGSSFKTAAGLLKIDPKTLATWKRCINDGAAAESQCGSNGAEDALLQWFEECARSSQPLNRKDAVNKLSSILDAPSFREANAASWFAEWISRLAPDVQLKTLSSSRQAGIQPFPHDSRVQYPCKFKLIVANLARNQSQASLSKALAVPRKQIAAWTQIKQVLVAQSNCDGEKSSRRRGVEAVNHAVAEKDLFSWYCHEHDSGGQYPKYAAVKEKARVLFSARGFHGLKFSYGWYTRWKNRYSVSSPRHPADEALVTWVHTQHDLNAIMALGSLMDEGARILSTISSPDSAARVTKDWAVSFLARNEKFMKAQGPSLPKNVVPMFDEFCAELRRLEGLYNVDSIGNVDEVYLNIASGSDSKSLLASTGPGTSTLGTVLLSCLANGRILPPVVILNAGTGGEVDEVPRSFRIGETRVILSTQGASSPFPLKEWLRTVWTTNVDAPSLLFLDAFPPHADETWRDLCSDEGVTVQQFPAGTACSRQPVDVCLKTRFLELFKSKLVFGGPAGRGQMSKIKRLAEAVGQTCSLLSAEKKDLLQVGFQNLFHQT